VVVNLSASEYIHWHNIAHSDERNSIVISRLEWQDASSDNRDTIRRKWVLNQCVSKYYYDQQIDRFN
jgi:hypothetical protein